MLIFYLVELNELILVSVYCKVLKNLINEK